jgi:hypothetical protein
MYAVEIDDDAADQITKLSPDALNAFAVVVDLVEFILLAFVETVRTVGSSR